jgi:hypothetical protein
MPDYLDRKIYEGLKRKTLRPEDELVDTLEETPRDIDLIEPDPWDWGGYTVNVLDRPSSNLLRLVQNL